MRKAKLKDYLTAEELRQRMLGSEEREQFQRWQALYLTSLGLTAAQVGEYVGISAGTVHQWVHQYNRAGPEEMVLEGRGGRRFGLLSLEQEANLLEGLRSEAEQGQVVAAFRIRQVVEKKAGQGVSKDYLYDLLHRHRWRKIMPRPLHPRRDWGVQQAFKKNSRSWWEPPPRVLPPRTSGR